MQYQPKVAMRELRKRLEARRVRILDRLFITELLTSDGQWPTGGMICGAAGFNIHGGQFVGVAAKRTIISTGMIAMKGTHRVDNDTGDGVAMAFRAGGRLVDMEFTFGGTFNVLMKRFDFPSYNVAVAHGARLINARGERFMEKYDPLRCERGELSHVVAAFAKEIADGRGPVFLDLRHADESYWTDMEKLHRGGSILLSNHVPDPRCHPLPIEPTWGMWASGRSGLQIDLNCHTNLEGLFAAGSAAKNNATGSHASAGSPTAFCNVTGWVSGETAAQESAELPDVSLSLKILKRLRAEALDPLGGSATRSVADELHDRLAELERSVVESMILNEARLQRFLNVAEEVADAVRRSEALDLHDLVKLHEAHNVALNAQVVYRSALDRHESREQFYREDYPSTDPDWFCWHGATFDGERIVFDREDFPLEGAHFQPEGEQTGLGPIGVIMRGEGTSDRTVAL